MTNRKLGPGNEQVLLTDRKGRQALFGLFSSRPSAVHPRRLVVAIHGKDRNAAGLFQLLRKRLLKLEQETRTLLVCPHFLIEDDIETYGLDHSWAFWSPAWNGWKYGYKSLRVPGRPEAARISSFAVLDQLVGSILRKHETIGEVVVMGHSSGGQMVHRYAAATPLPDRHTHVRFLFVPINAGTYLYFTPERPDPQRPGHWFIPDDCPGYDRYKYGLSDLHHCGYVMRVGAACMRANYPRREVHILVGEQDNDPDAPGIDNDNCRERLQGLTRLHRACNFFAHAQRTFGEALGNRHQLARLPECGHNIRHFLRQGALDPLLQGNGSGSHHRMS